MIEITCDETVFHFSESELSDEDDEFEFEKMFSKLINLNWFKGNLEKLHKLKRSWKIRSLKECL